MKKLLLLLFVLLSINTFAQSDSFKLKEGSFHKVEGCVTIPAHYDMNDLPMAVIKIIPENISEEERAKLVFEGNLATGIEVEQHVGETWVYVTARAVTFLRIKHPDFGVTEFMMPMEIEPKQCYEMVLQYIPMSSTATAMQQNNYLTIIADQPNASIYIDDQYVSDGFKSLAIGTTHTWKIECDMYHTESGSVTITSGEPITIEKKLRPAYGFISVASKPESGAVVFIDNKKVGTTPYQSDKMASGTYKVRVVKDMYKTAEQTYTITDGNTTNAVLDMNANFVVLTIDTDADSDIYIDGQHKGKGKWTGRIADGAHFVEVKKDKHRTVSKNLNLVLGKDENIKIEALTAITGLLDISSVPVKADIYLNGKHYGTTPRIISDLLIGEYTLKLEKEGCASVAKNIVIEENQTLTIKEQLPTGKEVVAVDKDMAEKKDKTMSNISFLTLNAAYSVALQTSFGFTYGQVNKFGWYLCAMSGLDFKAMNTDVACDEYGNVDGEMQLYSGEKTSSRLSIMAGMMYRPMDVLAIKLGAGYGMRHYALETMDGNWILYETCTYKGVDINAGLQFFVNRLSFSVDFVTTNAKYSEIKIGIGFLIIK